MRIAIFGSQESRDEVEPFANQVKFESVCSELGAVLSEKGHTLIVESDRRRTADRSVVKGVRELNPDLRGPVEAWHRTKAKVGGTVPREPFASDGWVRKIPIPVAHVGPAHMRILSEVHVAIVIGGGNNAYLAGQAARALDVRLLPVAAFGGAGRLLWHEVRGDRGSPLARTMDPQNLSQLGTVSSVVSAIGSEVDSLPRIMIVHGRSNDKDEVADLLKLSGATPIVMKDLFIAGETIPGEFERLALQADGAVVVITPDDEGRATIDADGGVRSVGSFGYRARQNVVLEYGWFWCRFGRKNVALVVRGDDVELPSDVSGVLYHRYRTTPRECEGELREFVGRFL